MSSQSHLDEKSFEQLLAAAYALQQQRGPVLVPSMSGNATATNVQASNTQRKGVRTATGNLNGKPLHGSALKSGMAKNSTSTATSGSTMTPPYGNAAGAETSRQKNTPEAEEAARLAAIVETQTAVHSHPLSLQASLDLLVSRAAVITQASGATIWLVQGGGVVCRATYGDDKNGNGQHIATETDTNRLAPCLHRGEMVRVEATSGADTPRLAVPVHHDGQVQGALEVVFPRWRRVKDADLQTCQILSGLVSEALTLAEGQNWKHVLDSERATLLEALDRIQPHLSRLLSEVDGAKTTEVVREIQAVSEPARSRSMSRLGEYLLTQKDDANDPKLSTDTEYPVEEQEDGDFLDDNFPEGGLLETPHPLASATDWQARDQQLRETAPKTPSTGNRRVPREVQTALNLSVAPTLRAPQGSASPWRDAGFKENELDGNEVGENEVGENEVNDTEPTTVEPQKTTSAGLAVPSVNRYTRMLAASAASTAPNPAVDFPTDISEDSEIAPADIVLDAELNDPLSAPLVAPQGFWVLRWADVCLAVSAAILLASLVWAFWPNSAQSMPSARSGAKSMASASQAVLTPFEQFLVSVGLAESPAPVAAYTGAPNVQVWVDLQTAQYYCDGAEGYGKTAKGKFLAQHEAQYQQFQPARGRPCD